MYKKILVLSSILLLLSSCTPYAAQSDVIIQQGGSQNIIENITYNNITNITSFNITNITSYNITNVTNITNNNNVNANLSIYSNGTFFNNITEFNIIGRGILLQNNDSRLNFTYQGDEVYNNGSYVMNTTGYDFSGLGLLVTNAGLRTNISYQGLEVRDENVRVLNTSIIDFVGSAVTVTQTQNRAVVTITSGGSSISTNQFENITRRNVRLNVLGTGSTYGVLGDVATITGTGSTPTVNISAGLQLNILGVAGTTSGLTGVAGNAIYYRDWDTIGLFKFRSVEVTNDTRKFAGFTTNAVATQMASDQPAGDYIGVFGSNTKWTNYAIVSSNNGVVQSINTSLNYNNADVMNVTVSMNASGCSVFFNNVEYGISAGSCPRTALAYRYVIGQINTSTTVRNLRTSSIFITSGQ